MRTLTQLTLLLGLLAFAPANASRVLEIEEFYHAKVKELLETRFPETPYSIFVTVDTGRTEPSRRDVQLSRAKRGKGKPLPYWYSDDVGVEDLDIWDRMDVPLGTLIKEVKSIRVNVQVDATLKESEMTELKEAIAKQLKLDPATDGIEISRMPWTDQERYRNLTWVGGLSFVAFLLIVGVFGFMARLSIQSLIRGLSQPIAEIGRNTQKFATSALNLASDLSVNSAVRERPETPIEEELDVDLNLLEVRKNALELLDRNQALFDKPDADFMEYLERKGKFDPVTMGSILAELPEQTLRGLFKFGAGDWWYKAVAQPAPLRPHSLALLGEIDRLRVRRQFGMKTGANSEEHRESSLILNRLKVEELTVIMKGLSLEEATPIIDLLPRDRGLAVAKALFPGQWAVFLQAREVVPPKKETLDEIRAKCLRLKPLRGDGEIQSFFQDLDLSEYLDVASPRDERDFYMVLPENSRVRSQRFPFFKVLEGDAKTIKTVASMFTPQEWALALATCEHGERRSVLEKFPDRLRYQVVQKSDELRTEMIDDVNVRRARRAIVNAFVDETYRQAAARANEILDTTEKVSSESHDQDDQTKQAA